MVGGVPKKRVKRNGECATKTRGGGGPVKSPRVTLTALGEQRDPWEGTIEGKCSKVKADESTSLTY